MTANLMRPLALFLVLTMLFNLSSVNAAGGQFSDSYPDPIYVHTLPGEVIPSVDPELVRQLTRDETSSYLIYLRHRADLSPAYLMDWQERGWFLMETLQAVAEFSQKEVRAYLDMQNADYQAFWIDNVIAVKSSNLATFNGLLTFTEIDRLQAEPRAFLLEPESVSVSEITPLGVELNIAHVNAPLVWDLGFNGAGITVANIDTGVRYTHQALINQYRGNLGGGEFDHNYNWWDPYKISIFPTDVHVYGHGTHTVGIMVGDDGGGNQIGMAPGASWIACRGCDSSSCGGVELYTCGQFMAAPWNLTETNPNPNMRPHVVNNSWGDCNQTYDPWYQGVIDSWQAAGIYPVFANGNAGNCGYPSPPGLNTVVNPARYGNVTGVGSTGKSDGQYANHSAWGPTDNLDTINPNGYPALKPQVVAPGVGIRSSVNGSDSEYGFMSGTSMSAPHVAGLVALMWQAAPGLIGDYSTTETILQNTANPILYDTGNGDEGPGNVPNHATGWGEIDALAAVTDAVKLLSEPQLLQVTLAIDSTISHPLTIKNPSIGEVEFQVSFFGQSQSSSSIHPMTGDPGQNLSGGMSSLTWVSAEPNEGTIGGLESLEILVTFEANLPAGDYHASLIVFNEDNPLLLEVPLSMSVIPDASYALSLSPAEASLSAFPGESVTYSLTLENSGNVTDLISLEITDNQWSVYLPENPLILNPNSATVFSVRVEIPYIAAPSGGSDTVVVTAHSRGDLSVSAASELTTQVKLREIFLPFIRNQSPQ